MRYLTRHTVPLLFICFLTGALGLIGPTSEAAAYEPPRAENGATVSPSAENEVADDMTSMSEPGSPTDSGYVLGRYLLPAIVFVLFITVVAAVIQRSNDTRPNDTRSARH